MRFRLLQATFQSIDADELFGPCDHGICGRGPRTRSPERIGVPVFDEQDAVIDIFRQPLVGDGAERDRLESRPDVEIADLSSHRRDEIVVAVDLAVFVRDRHYEPSSIENRHKAHEVAVVDLKGPESARLKVLAVSQDKIEECRDLHRNVLQFTIDDGDRIRRLASPQRLSDSDLGSYRQHARATLRLVPARADY